MSSRNILHFVSGPIKGGVTVSLARRHEYCPSNVSERVIAFPCSSAEATASAEDLGMPVLADDSWRATWRMLGAHLRVLDDPVLVFHTERDLLWALLAKILVRRDSRLVAVVHSRSLGTRPLLRPAALLMAFASRAVVDARISVSQEASTGSYGKALGESAIHNHSLQGSGLPWPEDTSGRSWRFMAVGRLVESKAFHRLVLGVDKAAAALRERNAKLVLVGEGPEESRLKRLVADLEVGDIIELPGPVWPVWSEMARAHCLLQSSLSEGAGLVTIEALTMGLRVASGPVGIAGELLALDDASRLFPTVPTSADWAEFLEEVTEQAPPSDAERTARAKHWRLHFSSRDDSQDYFELLTGN